MSEVDKSEKAKVEQHRLRGRNMYDVVNQLVDKYNSSNGWAVKRVTPSLLNFEVLLERSSAQAPEVKDDVTIDKGVVVEKEVDDKEVVKEKAPTEEKDVLVEKKAAVKPTTKANKKASATSADKIVEAKKV